jgi:hypothetical protein
MARFDGTGGGGRTDITTEEDLHEGLRAAVTGAAANGVDVCGGWSIERDDGTVAWDLEVTRLARRSTAHLRDAASPVASVVEAVAAREDVGPTDLPPLYDAVDPGLLDPLAAAGTDDAYRRLTFEYCGYRITVRSDGGIVLDG